MKAVFSLPAKLPLTSVPCGETASSKPPFLPFGSVLKILFLPPLLRPLLYVPGVAGGGVGGGAVKEDRWCLTVGGGEKSINRKTNTIFQRWWILCVSTRMFMKPFLTLTHGYASFSPPPLPAHCARGWSSASPRTLLLVGTTYSSWQTVVHTHTLKHTHSRTSDCSHLTGGLFESG